MMKKILIIHSNMELGGAESSLLGLLDTIDYSKYAVDLFLLNRSGGFIRRAAREADRVSTVCGYADARVLVVFGCGGDRDRQKG